jgi:hypothetical protein
VATVFIKEKSSTEGEETIRVGKLRLVDLAGSEKIEEPALNISITTFDRMIRGLSANNLVLSEMYDSKLTRLLKDTLRGETCTHLIATLSLDLNDLKEIKSTLCHATKSRLIKNNPKLNQKIVKSALNKSNQDEMTKLHSDFVSWRKAIGFGVPFFLYDDLMKIKYMEYFNEADRLKRKELEIEELFNGADMLSERVMAFSQKTPLKQESFVKQIEQFDVIRKINNKIQTIINSIIFFLRKCTENK